MSTTTRAPITNTAPAWAPASAPLWPVAWATAAGATSTSSAQPVPTWLADMENHEIRAASDSAAALFGIARESLRGRSIAELLPAATCVVDVEGRLLQVNAAFCTLLGLEPGSLAKANLRQFELEAEADATIRSAALGAGLRLGSIEQKEDEENVHIKFVLGEAPWCWSSDLIVQLLPALDKERVWIMAYGADRDMSGAKAAWDLAIRLQVNYSDRLHIRLGMR